MSNSNGGSAGGTTKASYEQWLKAQSNPVTSAISNGANAVANVASQAVANQSAQQAQIAQQNAQQAQQNAQQAQAQLAAQRQGALNAQQADAASRRAYEQQLQTQLNQQYVPITTVQDAYANRGNPYLDIANDYETRARANFTTQEEALNRQLAASKQATNASYDSAASGNYINYVKQQNALPEQLARLGVRGGASESALARIGNNYALNQGNTAASRAAAIASLQSSHDTNLANLKQALEQAVLDNRMTLQQAQVQYDDALQQRAAEEIRYNVETERAVKERAEDILRELHLRNDDLDRADRQRIEDMAREDVLTEMANARDDARYYEGIEQSERWRDEDQAIAQADKEYERAWAETQYRDSQKAKMLEEYAAGLIKYTDIDKLNKMAKNIKKKDGWSKDPFLYGKVQAINARIGELKAEKKNSVGGGGGGYSGGYSSSYGGGYSSGGNSGNSGSGGNGNGNSSSGGNSKALPQSALKAEAKNKQTSKKKSSGYLIHGEQSTNWQ